jgi:quaternary ammonium compound-resistance protein SugE
MIGRGTRPRTTDQYPERDKTGQGKVMSWIVLILSGVLEAVWATALGKSEGFTKLWPTVVFGVGLVLSMGGLAFAMRDISTGTAYAIWVGIGAALTVLYAMIFGGEPASIVKVLLVLGIVGCVIGLKLVGGEH